jgi:hypothetical protein
MSFILNQAHAINYLANWYTANPDYNSFTHEALEAIADFADETETPMEVDPVQLACEWEEFDSIEALRERFADYSGYDASDADDETLLEWVNEQTTCLTFELGTQTRHVLIQF